MDHFFARNLVPHLTRGGVPLRRDGVPPCGTSEACRTCFGVVKVGRYRQAGVPLTEGDVGFLRME
jgi:hypothetical protein